MAGVIACSNAIPVDAGACAQEAQDPNKQAAPPAVAPGPATVKPVAACGFCLEDGTKVPLTLGRELSSAKESTGNRVDFVVSEDVKVNDVVVIPKGSLAYGTIVEAQPKRRMGRAGKLNVRIEEVRLADGSRAKLRATQENKGKGRQGAMTAGLIGTGILFFPAAPLFLFMHGKDIVIAKDTPVVAYVDGNTELDATKFSPAPKPSEIKQHEEVPAKEKPEKPNASAFRLSF
jgi:hypothetical protein